MLTRRRASPAEMAAAALALEEQDAQQRILPFEEFCRERLQIVNKEGQRVPLVLNHAQRTVWELEQRLKREGRPPWLIILKDRKPGISTLAQAAAYHTVRTVDDAECLTLAQSQPDTRRIFRIAQRFYRFEPKDKPKKARGDTYAISFPHLGSVYEAQTAGSTAGGRGGTLRRVHCSEVGFYEDAATLHSALSNALATGAAYWWESTPNGKDGKGKAFHDAYQAAKLGKNNFTPVFFAWWHHPENRLSLLEPDELFPLDSEEEKRRDLYGLSLEQIKYWREKRLANSLEGKGLSTMSQEHPDNDEDCFLESGDPYFDRDLLARRRKEQVRPVFRVVEGGALHGLRIYREPVPGHEYTIGCDPAEGVEEDESALDVTDHTTGEQVAVWNRNDVDAHVFGKHTCTALGRMYTCRNGAPAYLVPERNNHGHAVIVAALEGGYPAVRIYHHTDPTEPGDRPSSRLGWPNNTGTHGLLAGDLGKMLVDGYPKVYDEQTHASIRAVERAANGGADFRGRDLAVARALSLKRAPVQSDRPRIPSRRESSSLR